MNDSLSKLDLHCVLFVVHYQIWWLPCKELVVQRLSFVVCLFIFITLSENKKVSLLSANNI